ncbi:acyl-CoA-binding protein [Mesonia ostreae]|uniref:Acyl-CoA-binding protein n=1 Tax=Mesonia ostreae TaxID=861110 RepID=A0ABU2KL27_9FLAO|nr:acyl-CoA-binding protein [Mesonia ostreae]MDT0295415.1 acyl-CoA-binding protein [Mesonia ostreae]
MDKKALLEKEFQEAYEKATHTKLRFPPDLMLHFYAFYKRATNDSTLYNVANSDDEQLISAFKMNAIFQVKNLTPDQAKKEYIKLVETYIPE